MNGRCCVLLPSIMWTYIIHVMNKGQNSIKEHTSTPNVYSHYYMTSLGCC